MLSFITSLYVESHGAPLVLEAIILTIGMAGSLTVYAWLVKTDMSTCIAIIIIFLFCFVLYGISFAFSLSGAVHTLFATFGAIIAGIILVLDTQMIA